MRSIRTQLVLWLVGGILLLTAAAGVGLYSYMDEVLEHSLDAALAAEAEAITGAVHVDDGQPRLQRADISDADVFHRDESFYFQIWRADGTTLARVAPTSAGKNPLPRLTNSRRRFSDSILPGGLSVRITELSFLAKGDEDEPEPSHQTAAHLVLVVAHDRRSIEGPLAVLMTGLLLAAAMVTAGILVIVTWGVRRGLRPLAKVSALADRIGPESLDVRFPGHGQLPPELLPIALKLNDLLDRLGAAFNRERRFSAAVAHELRTPLAELRTACDVALRWPEDAGSMCTALSEARDVAVQMSEMVQTLLSLARQNAGIETAFPREPVQLSAAIADAWPGFATAAATRDLSIERHLDAEAIVQTEPALLKAVLRSLLENCVCHTPAGGRILLRTARGEKNEWCLQLVNTCVGLSPADLEHLFEPFWRSDTARTGHGHVGLGLTLAKAYCEGMGISICATLMDETRALQMSLHFEPVANSQ